LVERRKLSFLSGLIPKEPFHDLISPPVEHSQRDFCRAGFLAEAAVDAKPGHMNRPDQMERKIRGDLTYGDQFLILQAAFLTDINRADITAAVTFYAPGEMLLPMSEGVLRRQGLQPLRGGFRRFPLEAKRFLSVGDGGMKIRTGGGLLQVRTAASQGQDQYFLRVDLVQFDQFIQGSPVAFSAQETHPDFGVDFADFHEYLRERITGNRVVAD
jgi:hypothetical protein